MLVRIRQSWLHLRCSACRWYNACTTPQVYEHCIVIAIANASVYVVSGLKIMIIINYEIIPRGLQHVVYCSALVHTQWKTKWKFWKAKLFMFALSYILRMTAQLNKIGKHLSLVYWILQQCMFSYFAELSWQERLRQSKLLSASNFFHAIVPVLINFFMQNYFSTDGPNVTQGCMHTTYTQNTLPACCATIV